ncbi:MAG: hypothetical protein R2912_08640 [Eubacteriales bacterium]
MSAIARFWDVNAGKVTVGGVDVKTMDPRRSCAACRLYFRMWCSSTIRCTITFASAIWTRRRSRSMPRQRPPAAMSSSSGCRKATGACSAKTVYALRRRTPAHLDCARAAENAPIILLDEATASLDRRTRRRFSRRFLA